MELLILVLLAIVSFLVASAVHELGHVLVGLIAGFKFYLFVAGPLGLKRNEDDRVVFYIEKDHSLWGGISATLPTGEEQENYQKFGWVLLGGPLASIVTGSIGLLAGNVGEVNFLLLFGLMSLGMGIVSLIPMRNGAFFTDGGRWLRMHKNEETKAVEIAIWNITQTSIVSGGFASVKLDDIALLQQDRDVRMQFVGHYFAYHFFKDHQDFDQAEAQKTILCGLKDQVPKQMVTLFKVE